MKSFFLTRVLPALMLLIAASETIMAQGPGSGGPAPGTPTVDPTATPLDGGASLLLAGGIAYGIKHLRARRKKAQVIPGSHRNSGLFRAKGPLLAYIAII